MPKRAAKKTDGKRNPDRRNGKAFARKQFDDKGRALTGRGKPSGHSVKGSRILGDCYRSLVCSADTIAQWNQCNCGKPYQPVLHSEVVL